MTETTDNIDAIRIGRGILFYDAACGVCRGGMERFGGRLRKRGFGLLPLQSPLATELTRCSTAALMEEAHLLTPQRRVLRGIDAVLYIAAANPLTRPLVWLARLPGAMAVLRFGYRLFARNRYRISAACGLDRERPRNRLRSFLPLAPVVLALACGMWMPAWVWMWTIAWSVFFACKWITLRRTHVRASVTRILAYLFTVPGMDASSFFGASRSAKPRAAEWIGAIRNLIVGAAMVWLLPRVLFTAHPTIAVWSAMIGMVLALHFGAFHLLALAWQSRGVAAAPLMNNPTRAISLAEFWGKRWNTGFSTLARGLVFAPLVRRGAGVHLATIAVFLVSGILHDLVISLPARGGFGLPTIYFLIQLAGVLAERLPRVRRVLARRRILARLYTFALLILPLPLLFHHAFVARVIVPFLHVIGGLS